MVEHVEAGALDFMMEAEVEVVKTVIWRVSRADGSEATISQTPRAMPPETGSTVAWSPLGTVAVKGPEPSASAPPRRGHRHRNQRAAG